MKQLLPPILILLLLLAGCAPKPLALIPDKPRTLLTEASFDALPQWQNESFDEALRAFVHNCESRLTRKRYPQACSAAPLATDARAFFESRFQPYFVRNAREDEPGLLTGYYEPLLQGSFEKSARYRYPVYGEPEDLLVIDLSSLYPEFKHKRLRGRVEGKRVVPYFERAELSEGNVSAPVICWVDDRVELFFLEIQGSGRIALDNGETLFVGYANQNGHPYRSIGRYLIGKGELKAHEASMQGIQRWIRSHPERADEVLHFNPSKVFFQQNRKGATGAMGLELNAMRSVAIDRKYIPLGSLLYISADDNRFDASRLVMAQDTGGAIAGPVRADLFFGFGEQAQRLAGGLKAPLGVWILLPKNRHIAAGR